MHDRHLNFSRRDALRLSSAAVAALNFPPASAFAAANADRPKPSDVIISARVPSADGLALARMAEATRCDWTYVDKGPFFSQLRDLGVDGAGGAINMIPPDRPSQATYRVGRQQDRSGMPIELPWLKGKGLYLGCVNNPDFLSLQIERARNALSVGAGWLQHDDPGGQVQAVSFGACWCRFCRVKAGAQGYDLETAMLQFQTQSTIDYVQALRAGINAVAGHPVPMSCNNFGLSTNAWVSLFDYGMCEIDKRDADIDRLVPKFRQFERDDWMQVVTLRSRDVGLNRTTIAAVHALGGAMIFPYNVYISTGARYSANPSDVLALYRFVRSIGPVLDASRFTEVTAETLLSPGSLASLDRAGVRTIVRRAGTRTILHFIPGAPARNARRVNISLATPVRAMLQSAERSAPKALQSASFRVAPWDWSVVTLG